MQVTKPAPAKTARIASRCSVKLKKRVRAAERQTGQRESEIIRAALTLFFSNHKTPAEIANAIYGTRAA